MYCPLQRLSVVPPDVLLVHSQPDFHAGEARDLTEARHVLALRAMSARPFPQQLVGASAHSGGPARTVGTSP